MKSCEIFHIADRGSFAWKWRHRPAHGPVIESEQKYQLFYECVAAALKDGYQPPVRCFAPGDGHVAAQVL